MAGHSPTKTVEMVGSSVLRRWLHRYEDPIPNFADKGDTAFNLGENREIFTHTNAFAGVILGSALAHDDITWNDRLAAGFFEP